MTAESAIRSRDLPPVAAVYGLITIAALLYRADLHSLANVWLDDAGTSHGILVAALVPVMIWLRRDRLQFECSWRFGHLLALALVTLLWLCARAATMSVVCWALLPLLAWLAIRVAFGRLTARTLAFPLAYFALSTPILKHLAPLLQSVSVFVAGLLLHAIGLQADIQTSVITIPEGSFQVTEGCSGVQFLTVAIATAAFYAFLNRLSPRQTLIALATSSAVAELANWIRIVVIIVIGHITEMRSPIIPHHDVLSWGIFVVGMVPLALLARNAAPLPAQAAATPAPAAAATGPAALWTACLVAILTLSVGPAASAIIDRRASEEPVPSLTVPRTPALDGPHAEASNWQPRYPGAAAQRQVLYRTAAGEVELFVAFYSAQGPRAKLLGDGSSLAGPGGWAEQQTRAADAARPFNETLLLNRNGDRRVLWFWYEARGERLTKATGLQVAMVRRLLGARARFGVVALSAPCVPTCDNAQAALARSYVAGLSTANAGTAVR